MGADPLLLFQIVIILLVARLTGLLMRLIRQPQVVGEMLAGLLLGPSLLGLYQGGVLRLFPPESHAALSMLSQLGVIIFMFLVGLEFDPRLIRHQGRMVAVTGTVGILIPMVCGALLAARLYHPFAGPKATHLSFVLFIAVAMSITAFPVLARILSERNLHKTRTGSVALACAAMDDVMGWSLLALVLALVNMQLGTSAHPFAQALETLLLTLLYVGVMFKFVRPLLGQLQAHYTARGYLTQNVMALLFILLLLSAWITDRIGIHSIFGAFIFGAVMPTESRLVKHLSEKIEDFTLVFLLPIFFVFTGLRTDLGLLNSAHLWSICALVIVTAVVGKIGGVSLAARWFGLPWRQSGLLGVLMNTRGLMELVVLNIGLDLGILSPAMFSMMVAMALFTTFMTAPLMHWLYSPERQNQELAELREPAPGTRILVSIENAASVPALMKIGAMLLSNEPGRLYALHLDRPGEPELRARSLIAMEDVLALASREAQSLKVPICTLGQTSLQIARDIQASASTFQASWVLLGWHKPLLFESVLGDTLHQVLKLIPSHVAIFIDKGLGQVRRILVPYLGEAQDAGALLAAERLGRLSDVQVTILHVVQPQRSDQEARLRVDRLVDRHMPAVGSANTVRFQILESEDPVATVFEHSKDYDLMVLGLSERWHLDSGLLGHRQASVAEQTACSLLIVRAGPGS